MRRILKCTIIAVLVFFMALPVYQLPADAEEKEYPVASMSYQGHYYEVYENTMTWKESKKFCEELGGHLVTITTAAENAAVSNLIAKGNFYTYCMGMDRESGSYQWITGEPLSYTNWDTAALEPTKLDGELYCYIVAKTGKAWLDLITYHETKWVDYMNDPLVYSSATTGLVCEYDEKIPNVITAENVSKNVSASEQSFYLDASALDNTKLTFKSNNKNIQVDFDGEITIKKKYIGKATITIASEETDKYQAAKKKITVTVTPGKTAISSAKTPKAKQLKVTWKKNSYATGYQIYYSTDKSFSENTKSVKLSKAATVSKTITSLKSKKTYYVKVRAYKTVDETDIYGSWSSVKSCKVK